MPTEVADENKVKKRRKMKRKKIRNVKEMASEDELVKNRLNAKFKMKTHRSSDDGMPCLRMGKKEQMVVRNGEKHDILLKRSQEALLNRLNQVECNEAKITTRWKCALCQQRTLRSVLGDLFGPYFMRLSGSHWPTHLAKNHKNLMSRAFRYFTELYCDIWLHGPCALTAPGIYLVGNQLDGLEAKISSFWAQHCAVCSKEGAAIENRGKYYHFPCAMQKESSMMDKVTYELQEKVVVIIWDWVSVQVPLDKITLFISKVYNA
ncbi:hypothetical protein DINM_004067 [Dirofilaria immitis]|nr:hypothetical protein [Dirofilaria immitis]